MQIHNETRVTGPAERRVALLDRIQGRMVDAEPLVTVDVEGMGDSGEGELAAIHLLAPLRGELLELRLAVLLSPDRGGERPRIGDPRTRRQLLLQRGEPGTRPKRRLLRRLLRERMFQMPRRTHDP